MILISTWATFWGCSFLATLACGVLVRRGFIPLHMSAIVGAGAYTFVYAGQTGWTIVPAALWAVGGATLVSAASASVFLRARAGAAALASIGVQLVFDQYVRSVAWTGGAVGTWEGVPILSSNERLLTTVLAVGAGCVVFVGFRASSAARVNVVDGWTPLLASSAFTNRAWVSLLVASCVVGVCGGLGGLILTIQTGLVAPSMFSMYSSLLYASVVVMVGHYSLPSIALLTTIVALLPEWLRFLGLGTAEASAWRGVVVGLAMLLIVWRQAPRPSRTGHGE